MSSTQTEALLPAKVLATPASEKPSARRPAAVKPKPDLVVSACTAQHKGDRKEQQDRVLLLSGAAPKQDTTDGTGPTPPVRRHALAVLADGLGGMSGGALASENVMLIAQSRFNEFVPDLETEKLGDKQPEKQREKQFFKELVEESHTVISIAAMTSELEPHTTFTGLLVQQHRVDWCHVGDSRIYHFRQGHLMSVSEDHTLAWQLVQEGKPVEKATMHPQAHKLVNTVGGRIAPIPVYGHIENPRGGDAFLLCSDGLWSYFDPMELGTLIVSLPAGQAASRLISLARERAEGKGDNVSLALIKYDLPEGSAEADEPDDLTVNSRWL
jgi:PPM family protein phosphatase